MTVTQPRWCAVRAAAGRAADNGRHLGCAASPGSQYNQLQARLCRLRLLYETKNTAEGHRKTKLKLRRQFQPSGSKNSTNHNKMSQVATVVNSELAAAVVDAENANPNAESPALLKAKVDSAELPISENSRSESSTPVKEILDDQPVAADKTVGNKTDGFIVATVPFMYSACVNDSNSFF
jgi:hypothetical protein